MAYRTTQRVDGFRRNAMELADDVRWDMGLLTNRVKEGVERVRLTRNLSRLKAIGDRLTQDGEYEQMWDDGVSQVRYGSYQDAESWRINALTPSGLRVEAGINHRVNSLEILGRIYDKNGQEILTAVMIDTNSSAHNAREARFLLDAAVDVVNPALLGAMPQVDFDTRFRV